jgi:hypothetical protein
MTAVPVTPTAAAPISPVRRTLTVSRVLYLNWPMALAFPLGIMATSFIINILIFAALGDAAAEGGTGGLASLYIVQLIVCWQGMLQNFAFSVGLNVTRRAFYAASVLVATIQSVGYAVFLYGCALVERATDGWGVHLHFFDPLPVTHSFSPVTILVYAVPLLLISFLGLFLGAVNKRWGSTGVFILAIVSIFVLGGIAALITFLDGWPAVGHWLVARSWRSIAIGWSLIPAALAAAGGWWVLRRTVP